MTSNNASISLRWLYESAASVVSSLCTYLYYLCVARRVGAVISIRRVALAVVECHKIYVNSHTHTRIIAKRHLLVADDIYLCVYVVPIKCHTLTLGTRCIQLYLG